MPFFRSAGASSIPGFQPQLRVVGYIATRRGDAERGPQVRLNPADAVLRLLTDGELAWVQGERGQQLAELVIDPAVSPYECVLRDIPGVVLSEAVRVMKPDLDSPKRPVA